MHGVKAEGRFLWRESWSARAPKQGWEAGMRKEPQKQNWYIVHNEAHYFTCQSKTTLIRKRKNNKLSLYTLIRKIKQYTRHKKSYG